MGCATTETPEEKQLRERRKSALKINKDLDKQMRSEARESRKVVKLLLLGAGESGKSTLFKQMTIIHGKGYSEEKRKERTQVIFHNVITTAKMLIRATVALKDHPDVHEDCSIRSSDGLRAVMTIADCPSTANVDQKIADAVEALLREPGIQRVLEHKSLYQWPTSGGYFMERVRAIAQPGYIPSMEDILKSRVRTTGIVEKEVNIDGVDFKIFDVGGQRNERKKWIHCFDDVTALIFVAAISEYDQTLLEDRSGNRMDEALLLFEEICRSKWFKETSIILFLNKKDVFEEKIKTVPISTWHKMSKLKNVEPYRGRRNNYEDGCEYWRKVFKSRARRTGQGARASALNQVYAHVTCATDTQNIRHVFKSVQDIVITRSMFEDGVL